MANVTNWLTFQSAADPNGGFLGAPWTNPTGALLVGGFEASSGPVGLLATEPQTGVLRISQPNVAGSLPLEFRLLGVEVEVRGRWSGATLGSRSVQVESVVGSSVRQALGSCALPLSPTPSACVKGSPTNTLGFNEADVALAGFGFQLTGSSNTFDVQGNTLFVDSVRVRFHWADPLAPGRSRRRTRSALTRGGLS